MNSGDNAHVWKPFDPKKAPVLLLLFIFIACSGNVPPSTTTLTQSQADELAHAMGTRIENNYWEGTDEPVDSSGNIPIDRTDSCVHSTGTIKSSGSFSFDLDQQGCGAAVTYSGLIKVSGSVTAAENNKFRWGYSVTGSLEVSGPNVTAGTCGVSYQTEILHSSVFERSDPNVSGTICDVPVTIALFD